VTTELWRLGLVAAGRAIAGGEVTPTQVVEAVLERIGAVEPTLNAFVVVDREGALEQAAELTAESRTGDSRGPLHGVPVAIKDIFDVAGLPTRRGSAAFADAPPATRDADVVGLLRRAGAVIVGKTTTHELACGVYTEGTSNPWGPSRCCGGSSGGSAAAVAAGGAMGATGSDTGGSIRIPASLCGLVGIKPTFDLVSKRGVAALAWSLDHVGPLTRSVEDAAVMLDVMAGGAVGPITQVDLSGLTIGIPREPVFTLAEPAVTAAFEHSCAVLAGAGAHLVDVAIPELADALTVEFAIVMAEGASYYERELRHQGERIGPAIRTLFHAGSVLPAVSYLRAQRLRGLICEAIARALGSVDVLCTPTVLVQAYRPDQEELLIDGVAAPIIELTVGTTAPFNLSGLPAISVPMGLSGEGLPLGLQLVAGAFEDARLLGVAHAFESLLSPPVPVAGDLVAVRSSSDERSKQR
jgi:aspartyl-tRNA(Asn)/glutamyl-tRNA(Gln) amidotransferase subunit A